jgi:hypothetical protein
VIRKTKSVGCENKEGPDTTGTSDGIVDINYKYSLLVFIKQRERQKRYKTVSLE